MKCNELIWEVGYAKDASLQPEQWIPACVPGAVQLDWAKANEWGHYTFDDNWKEYQWMEDVYWTYKSKYNQPKTGENQRVYFVSKGIDYQFLIRLNGEQIFEQEGMFTYVEIDITEKLKKVNELEILVFPTPKREGAPQGRWQADQSCKPPVSYGWDWHPRLIPLGIWDETYLDIRPSCHIQSSEVVYELNESCTSVEVQLKYELSKVEAGIIRWTLYEPCGNILLKQESTTSESVGMLKASLQNPKLWWPNEQGEQDLYLSKMELITSEEKWIDEKTVKVGFRRARLVMHPGAWEYPNRFPKSRSNPPITMEINGRQIFCKGSNWVNPEIFPGILNKESYQPLVQLAKDAHMNMFRVWGGGIVNKEAFFELCDEYGIMVWQEFPLACNNYLAQPSYLKVLDQESRSILQRVRQHASLVLWCGGNELFNAWSGMTEQSLALRLLNRNCYDLDPKTPFIMTSPLMGMAHGNYLFQYDTGEEVFQVMSAASNTAYTEFGCPGPSQVECLESFIPQKDLFPPKVGTAWESHHAFGAWTADTWLQSKVIEHYFGKSTTLEELVERGQLLQCEGYKCIFEESRRQKPVCSMALNWCYNEPWPTAANNSIIQWPATPKPAYEAVKSSCRPALASARIPKFSWKEGEVFSPELWVLNDLPECLECSTLEAYLCFEEEELLLLSWRYPNLEPNTNEIGPVIKYRLPKRQAERMRLVLRVVGQERMNSEYMLLYSPIEKKAASKVRELNL